MNQLDDEDNPFNFKQDEDLGNLEQDEYNYDYDQKQTMNNLNSPAESSDQNIQQHQQTINYPSKSDNLKFKFKKSDFQSLPISDKLASQQLGSQINVSQKQLDFKAVNRPNDDLIITVSEFEDVNLRLQNCLKQIELVQDAYSSKQNFLQLRLKIDKVCESSTFRAKIIQYFKQIKNSSFPSLNTDIYKIELLDLQISGSSGFTGAGQNKRRYQFLLLKYNQINDKSLRLSEDKKYLMDRVKLILNKHGEIVILSTKQSVMIEYELSGSSQQDVEKFQDEDSFELEDTLDRTNEIIQKLDSKRFSSISNQIMKQSDFNHENYVKINKDEDQIAYENSQEKREEEEMQEYQNNRDELQYIPQYQFKNKPGINDIFQLIFNSDNDQLKLQKVPILSSTKQILQKAQNLLNSLNNCDEEQMKITEKENIKQIWSARELLTWKIPESMSSTGCNLQRSRVEAEFLPPPICLYKFQLVTQRIKEQNVTFCGIITHVKQGNWELDKNKKHGGEQGQLKDQESDKLITSQIDMESIDDKSKFALFMKHHAHVDLKSYIQKGQVVLVCDATRKISNNLDIYTQLLLSKNNFKIIGRVEEDVNDFEANNRIQLLKKISGNHIIRHMIKVCGFIVEINFIKIQYRCDKCKTDIQSEQICRNGCYIENPQLLLQVLCIVQDGTMKASLELKNEKVINAFQISDADQKRFKDYCLKYGQFMNPSSAQNFHYKDIVSCFKKYDTWNQMIFYCKPYCKVQNSMDKKQNNGNQFSIGYNDTISKPSFLAQEKVKEKEIFLNGEINTIQKKGQQQFDQIIKKTNICLKGIMVDSKLSREAIKNYYNLNN